MYTADTKVEYRKLPKFHVESTVGTNSWAHLVAPKYSWANYIVVEHPHLVSVSIYGVVSVVVSKVRNAYPVGWSGKWEAAWMKLHSGTSVAELSRKSYKIIPETVYRNISTDN